ncbi:hypothetical protein [Tumebacillus algifaecis]|uniref:hypothetical protein n=1 Tax=Tumebacillus algifaecis TaxID=1214604 RepID=UPI0012FD17D7|nr:hypothetical protein [Tumebacillus algifaecis]
MTAHPKRRKYERHWKKVLPKIDQIAKDTAEKLDELFLSDDAEDVDVSYAAIRDMFAVKLHSEMQNRRMWRLRKVNQPEKGGTE